MDEDKRLIRQLRQGDNGVLCRVYERYKDDLITIGICLLRDRSAAEDVLHDVFVNLAAKAGDLSVRKNLKGYLATSVANRARDRLRSIRSRRQEPAQAPLEEVESAAAGPVARLLESEEAQQLYEALTQLADEQREVITLRLHGDVTFRLIAKEQGVSINTVQSRYRYGLRKLRSLLDAGVNR